MTDRPSLLFLAAASLLSGCTSVQVKMTSAAVLGQDRKLEKLITPKADVNAAAVPEGTWNECPESKPMTPLQGAACAGETGAMAVLLSHGADPNATGTRSVGPLIFALAYKRASAAKLLLQKGAKADVADSQGKPALHHAAMLGDPGLTGLILDQGVAVDLEDANGYTALMFSPNAKTAELLLAKKADLAKADKTGDTALHWAAKGGRADVVRLLLEKGADWDLKDNAGKAPLDLARESGGADAIAPLEELARQALKKRIASGDKAAQGGDADSAMTIYTDALRESAALGMDEPLRVKIVKFGAALGAPPAVPDAAREHLVRADYYLKNGRGSDQVESEIRAAVDLAPWWADGYYNLGLVQASGSRFKEAMKTLQLFLTAAPNHPKAREAQDKIFELKIAQEEADKVAGMAGDWNGRNVTVQGSHIMIYGSGYHFDLTLKQDALTGTVESSPSSGGHGCTVPGQNHPVTGTVNAARDRIELDYVWNTYNVHYHCVDMFGNASNCCLLCSEVCDAVSIAGTSNEHLTLTR